MSYHLTAEGPKRCTASVRACPLGGEHFDDKKAAEKAFEASMDNSLVLSKKDNRLAPIVIPSLEFNPEAFSDKATLYRVEPGRILEDAKELCKTIAAGEIPQNIPLSLAFDDGWRSGMASIITHSELMDLGYYGRATKDTAESIAANVGDGTVLDPMAGRGFFAKALREAGVKTIASDDYSWKMQADFEKLDAIESVKKYGNQISHVLLSWVPHGSGKDLEILQLCRKEFPHITIINIGEGHGGATGSEAFWDHAKEIETEAPISYSTTSTIHDFVAFVK